MKTATVKSAIRASMLAAMFIGGSAVLAQNSATTTQHNSTATTAKKHEGAKGHPAKAYIEQMAAKIKEFFTQKRQEAKTFKESLKGKSAEDQKTAIDQFRTEKIAEVKAFITQQRNDVTQKIQNDSNIPDAKKSEILQNLQDRWAKRDANWEKQMQENTQLLEKIFSDGKVTAEEKEQLKENRQTQRKENKAFNNSLKKNKSSSNTTTTASAATTTTTSSN